MRKAVKVVVIIIILNLILSMGTFASDNTLKYYLGDVVNTGKDNGFSESNKLKESDPHYGWKLGHFFVDGYTRVTTGKDQTPIFLKNVGDKITLWFNLEQDINNLNSKKSLSISEDKNGYDSNFGVQKQNFKKGTLIIKHTDYQNLSGEPVVYTNYLSANAKKDKDVKVELFEEGDYEVSLDYEIKNDPRNLWGLSIIPTYTNYKIHFKFSVRNGNCMVYPFDAKTGAELNNTSFTENGFYLDLAKSRYLIIDIKKEIMNEGAEGLVEDTRFNRPVKDGDKYTEEGIYTITVTNRYTELQTVKKIYVGKNDILKAYVTTGYPISEIKYQVANGAVINEDGSMSYLVRKPTVEEPTTHAIVIPEERKDTISTNNDVLNNKFVFIICVSSAVLLLIAVIVILIVIRKKKKAKLAIAKLEDAESEADKDA